MASLSVAIIARNEERNLVRALESVQRVADEIVVTDTGSTDRTISIARSAGARVCHSVWCDDFSAAYNACLEQVRTEWVLLLDADEELLADSQAEVREAIDRSDALAYTVLRQDLVRLDRPEAFTEMLQTRLFRAWRDLRFVGRIHHQFALPLHEIAAREGMHVLPSTIRLRHYGYAAGLSNEKLSRAAALMELELRDRPGQFYYLVELGRSWVAMGDPRGAELLSQAAAVFRDEPSRALESGGAAAMLLEHILACDTLPPSFPLDRVAAEQLAARHFPRAVPLLWQIALQRFKQERFEVCARLLERILLLANSGDYDRLASFEPRIMQGDALLNLGVCYARLARIADARRCFQELLAHEDYVDRARRNLQSLDGLKQS